MSDRLCWRDATKADRDALQHFQCAEERPKGPGGRPLPHPFPWKQEVQVGLRARCKPPRQDGVVLLGETSAGELVAVVWLHEVSREDRRMTMKLMAVAVALPYQGDHYGAEAVRNALRAAEDWAYGSGHKEVFVFGYVHEDNLASQTVCRGNGLRPREVSGSYGVWGINLELIEDLSEFQAG